MTREDARMVGRFASCGRDAVNIVQMCAGLAQMENRTDIRTEDVEWVVYSGHYAARPDQHADTRNRVGVVHGLAIVGSYQGATMEIEAVAQPGCGRLTITGNRGGGGAGCGRTPHQAQIHGRQLAGKRHDAAKRHGLSYPRL